MRAARVLGVLFVVCWAQACGGRFEKTTTGSAASASSATAGGSSGVSGSSSVDMPPDLCPCDPIACPQGYTSQPNPNSCCPQCAIDLAACEKTQKAYTDLRQQLITQAQTLPCMTDADCFIFEDSTGCSPTCGFVMSHVAGRGVADPLNLFASTNCNSDCPVPPQPPCAPPQTPRCVANLCQ